MEHLILGDQLHAALNDLNLPKFDMIDWQESTESTNNDCKLWASRGAVRALSISNHQTAGRGQSNRVWQSPKGNLYLSLLTDLPSPVDGRLALEVGLALVNMPILQNLELSVKWPNDLYANGAKWGGILIEPIHSHNIEHGVIIGVGINLQPMQVSVSDRTVTDLNTLLDQSEVKKIDLVQLAVGVIQALQSAIDSFLKDSPQLPHRFLPYDALANKAIQITQPEQPPLFARAVGIAEDGSLQISTVHGIEQLYSGQIRVMD
ncbi:MAG: biotin--[acetyl-CoA-carboxylase] ligase [Candidatus Saccharibacteria bacterium]|nr:biotin--[acetyl-CoA-carboxylase] ligase [Moraxellaceae bacterium]